MKRRLLKTLHETAKDLADTGLMSARTMRDFDALCLPPVKPFSPAKIRRLRLRSKASQAVFAAYLNTSVSTMQKWERGEKKPNGPSLKLLDIVARKGLEALG